MLFGSILGNLGGYLVLDQQTALISGNASLLDLCSQVLPILFTRANGGPVSKSRKKLYGWRTWPRNVYTKVTGGTITPNHALGGSTNIVVNVDASGSSVEGDEEQGRELGRMISVAIQSELIKQKRPGGILA